jgi:hydrogenase maturation factor HypF (carbamoyltransferase family)
LPTNDKEKIKKFYKNYDAAAIVDLIDKKINSPLCSSVGRLFDGIASLIDIKQYRFIRRAGCNAIREYNTLKMILKIDTALKL